MEKWFVQSKKADFDKIGRKFGIDPVIARLIRNREIVEEEDIERYLHPSLEHMYSPYLMKDMEKAAGIILGKIKEKKKIRIISDYDVDGVISNYILLQGLMQIGANVDYEIPDRIVDGYGINEHLIQAAYDAGIDTIITCDNGIAAIDQIAYAKKLGMTVIVTDHHDIPFEETKSGRCYLSSMADAIVNPKQKECKYPFSNLCGAGVAYKLVEVLYEKTGIPHSEAVSLIEYVAIATVCDVVDLQNENRILVKHGLEKINHTKNLGLAALIEVNGLAEKEISAYHLGFVIGPCINATGRLTTAKKSLQLLLAKTSQEALACAVELKKLNDERKSMTEKGMEEAFYQVEHSDIANDNVLVVYLPECHESLAGIIAGRVRERYHKPAFVITDTSDGLKGSGRSIEAYSMFDELTGCKEFLTKFGGHPMAAGLSLAKESLSSFRRALNERSHLTADDLTAKVSIDVPMPIDYVTMPLIEQLNLLEPFGKANSKPLFAEKGWKLLNGRILGKNRNVMKFTICNLAGAQKDAIYFGNIDLITEYLVDKFGNNELDRLLQGRENKITLDCTYYPSINEYNGKKTIQFVIQNYK